MFHHGRQIPKVWSPEEKEEEEMRRSSSREGQKLEALGTRTRQASFPTSGVWGQVRPMRMLTMS